MASLAQWERYVSELEPLARWSPPDTAAGRDLLERLRTRNDAGAVLQQALDLTRVAWRALPQDMRADALTAVGNAIDQAVANLGDAIDTVPVAGQVAGYYIAAIEKFVWSGKEIKKENKRISNFAHQRAHFMTVASLRDPWTWVYAPATVKMYAQHVKVRTGGDWDVVPGFTRSGLRRDEPFLGHPSPPDTGDCKKAIRIGLDYVWDPASTCRRVLGLSALFYPWWSGAYAPDPLPVWDPETTTNANRLLVHRQSQLLTDPYTNLRVPVRVVQKIHDRVMAYFGIGGAMYPIDRAGNVTGKKGPRIDAKHDAAHVPSKSAAARWYVTADGFVEAYPDQPDSGMDDWGWPAPPGEPTNLGVTIAQRNAVHSMTVAFMARRLSTLRNGKLAAGLLEDYGPGPMDDAAVPALEYAAGQRKMLPMVGDGPAVKKLIFQAPGAILPPQGEGGGELAAAAAVAALLFL